MEKVLLITPPFTQLNTPYPATAYLKGFLNTKNISSFQMDLGLEVILELFSKEGLESMFAEAEKSLGESSENAQKIYTQRNQYIRSIDPVIKFLQGHNGTFARRLALTDFLPRAARFEQLDDLEWAFGTMGIQDRAKHLATLYLEDISDFIIECLDEHFGFSRYAERLGRSANSFDELYGKLNDNETYIDRITLKILHNHLRETQPNLVCLSVPFPGNLYSAFRCGQFIKQYFKNIKIALGGGFANTELRSVSDPRVFEFVDYITLDDGELPIEVIHSNIKNPNKNNPDHDLYKRTFLLKDGKVFYNNFSLRKDYPQEKCGTPDYRDLLLEKYISVTELLNPMHSLWSDGRWNKLTMAHGCYWGKCTFCDISLDYIKNYQPVAAALLVDRMEEQILQTGTTGFHFVDEAAPPALMREVALEILRRDLVVSWWTNIRFEKSFTPDLCRLLKASGCIAVSGGLEVASNRLLELIQKGVTVEQVAQVTANFTDAEILVHAYLMYGYPTQTIPETIDSLEMVRQLFELGVIHSGFWHQFALTAHSPVGMEPAAYGIKPDYKNISFANNDIAFQDSTGIGHDQFSYGLKKSLFNFMRDVGFDLPLQNWFDFPVPDTEIENDFILNAVESRELPQPKAHSKIVWISALPKKQNTEAGLELTFYQGESSLILELDPALGNWIYRMLEKAIPAKDSHLTFADFQASFEEVFQDFELFWESEELELLRGVGLLVL